MRTLHQTIVACLEAKGLQFHYDHFDNRYSFCQRRDMGTLWCPTRVVVDSDHITVYHSFPLVIPKPRRHAMALLVLDLNRMIAVGGFEFPTDSGELLFKMVHLTIDGIPSLHTVEYLLNTGIHFMERFMWGFLEVAVTDKHPRQVFFDLVVDDDDAEPILEPITDLL